MDNVDAKTFTSSNPDGVRKCKSFVAKCLAIITVFSYKFTALKK